MGVYNIRVLLIILICIYTAPLCFSNDDSVVYDSSSSQEEKTQEKSILKEINPNNIIHTNHTSGAEYKVTDVVILAKMLIFMPILLASLVLLIVVFYYLLEKYFS